jgi:hypothetical protein
MILAPNYLTRWPPFYTHVTIWKPLTLRLGIFHVFKLKSSYSHSCSLSCFCTFVMHLCVITKSLSLHACIPLITLKPNSSVLLTMHGIQAFTTLFIASINSSLSYPCNFKTCWTFGKLMQFVQTMSKCGVCIKKLYFSFFSFKVV